MYIYLSGGLDSYNLLVPHSECSGTDMYQQYVDVRNDVALPKSQLLELDVPAGTQVCDKFGLHHRLPVVKQLYDEGEAAFVANIGPMVEPTSREQWDAGQVQLPPQLYSHNL